MLTVFLSSTSKDLHPCRNAAYAAISGLHGYHCVRMEDFGSWDAAPDDFCRSKVAECDLVVCIVGPLYGSRTPAGPSFTEREFDAAIAHEKPCLVFVTADDYPLAANLIEADEERKQQAAFRQRVTKGRLVTAFSTPEEVSVKVVQAIRNWEAARPVGNAPSQASLLTSQINPVSYRVAVINRSTRVGDEEMRGAVMALQKQVRRDFAPVWGIDAELTLVAKGADPEPGSWWVMIEDQSEFPSIIAYHTLTPEGLPYVRVSVVTAQQSDFAWTMAASHDLLEMLANPRVNLTVFDSSDGIQGKLYIREICDPVSSPLQAYSIDGIVVSDFVYPSWFESYRKSGGTQFDHAGHVNEPFQIARGARSMVCEVTASSGWRQIFAFDDPPPAAPLPQPELQPKKSRKR